MAKPRRLTGGRRQEGGAQLGQGFSSGASRDRREFAVEDSERLLSSEERDAFTSPEQGFFEEGMRIEADAQQAVLEKKSSAAAAADTLLSDEIKEELKMDALENSYTAFDSERAGNSEEDYADYTQAKEKYEILTAEKKILQENLRLTNVSPVIRWGRFFNVFSKRENRYNEANRVLEVKKDVARFKKASHESLGISEMIRAFEANVKYKTGLELPTNEKFVELESGDLIDEAPAQFEKSPKDIEEESALQASSEKSAEINAVLSEERKEDLQMDALDGAYTLQNAIDAELLQKDHDSYTEAKQNLAVQKAEKDILRSGLEAGSVSPIAETFRFLNIFAGAEARKNEAERVQAVKRDIADLKQVNASIRANKGIVEGHELKIKQALKIDPPERLSEAELKTEAKMKRGDQK